MVLLCFAASHFKGYQDQAFGFQQTWAGQLGVLEAEVNPHANHTANTEASETARLGKTGAFFVSIACH